MEVNNQHQALANEPAPTMPSSNASPTALKVSAIPPVPQGTTQFNTATPFRFGAVRPFRIISAVLLSCFGMVVISVVILTIGFQLYHDVFSAESHNNKGEALYKQGKYDDALSELNKAINIDPKFATAYNNRGLVYLKQEEYGKAVSDLSQAIRLKPVDAKAYSNRGLVYTKEDDYEDALTDLNQAIHIDPNLSVAYSNRGFLYQGEGDYEHALPDYNKAIQLAPNDMTAIFNRATVYMATGDTANAITDFNKVVQKGTDAQLQEKAAAYLVKLGSK